MHGFYWVCVCSCNVGGRPRLRKEPAAEVRSGGESKVCADHGHGHHGRGADLYGRSRAGNRGLDPGGGRAGAVQRYATCSF
jgi:hypothetical protein